MQSVCICPRMFFKIWKAFTVLASKLQNPSTIWIVYERGRGDLTDSGGEMLLTWWWIKPWKIPGSLWKYTRKQWCKQEAQRP
jgi:hypothetical protein